MWPAETNHKQLKPEEEGMSCLQEIICQILAAKFSSIFNYPPGHRNNQKTRVFARFYLNIKGFRLFLTRDNCGTDNCGTENCGTDNCGTENCGTANCGTDNCGTDNCGTENCGTENCGTETCGIICFFLFHTFLCVHMLFSAMLAYSRDFSRMYTWFTYFC